MGDPVEIFGAMVSRSTRPQGPPRPEGPSARRELEGMAREGDRVLMRALLLAGSLTLGLVAWEAVREVPEGVASVEGPPGMTPP